MQRTESGKRALRALSLILSLGVLAALAVPTASAQVFTDPVGFRTMTVLGTSNSPGANPYVTLHGLGMTQLPVSRGNATAVSANKVGVNATLTAGQFNKSVDNFPTHFIEITSGTCQGFQTDIVSNDTTSVFTDQDLTSCIGTGATYKIYPHWTIGTLFGPQNQAGFLGGSAATADQIQVWSVGSQAYSAAYYFKTTGLAGGTGWRSTASLTVNVTNVPVYIDQSLLIARRVSTNLDVKVVGSVKLGPTISTVFSNGAGPGGSTATIIGNPYPAPFTLGTMGIYTGNPATGLVGGSAAAADQIQIWVPGSQSYGIAYYFKTTGLAGGTGWRSTASLSVDVSTNQIPLGASMLVLRRLNNPQFNWSAPQPFTQ